MSTLLVVNRNDPPIHIRRTVSNWCLAAGYRRNRQACVTSAFLHAFLVTLSKKSCQPQKKSVLQDKLRRDMHGVEAA
jgi:hypothetical protein